MTVLAVNLVDRVAEILTRYSMLSPPTRVGVAVSGGADSISLLHILHRLARRFELSLVVLHVNHQLRGEESDGDEEFVRQLTAELGWPFTSVQGPPSSTRNLEAEMRNLRRQFFEKVRVSENLDRIALGHTRSDQAETVLFRLLRGTGTAGLAAMRPIQHALIRPLLTIGREEIRAWARSEGLAWREDRTNLDPQFTRNRLRIETLPDLAGAYNPNLESILAGTASLAQAEEDFWDELVASSFRSLRQDTRWGLAMDTGEINRLPLALRRRVIRRTLAEIRGDLRGLDFQHVESVLQVCASQYGHDRVIIPEADIFRSFSTVLFAVPGRLGEPREYRLPIDSGKDYALPHDAGVLRLEVVTDRSPFCASFKNERHFLKFSALETGSRAHPLVVRNWRPGDALKRPGHRNPEKLKSLFQEHRIALWERKHWPVLVLGEEIVWTRQFGCGEGFEAQPDSTGSVFHLTYRETPARVGFTCPI
jgi:tRNA(Ile)-lysidine synthase